MAKAAIHSWIISNVSMNLHPDVCLIVPFAKDNNGYTNFRLNGEFYKVHRFVCTKYHGQPGFGQEASHSCGVSSCVNPHHLGWKTHADNMRDTMIHGTVRRGAKHHATALTEDDVRAIRADVRSKKQIAEHYGIDVKTVYRIRQRQTWGHV